MSWSHCLETPRRQHWGTQILEGQRSHCSCFLQQAKAKFACEVLHRLPPLESHILASKQESSPQTCFKCDIGHRSPKIETANLYTHLSPNAIATLYKCHYFDKEKWAQKL